ncbi:MAG: hypothetical protein IJY61_01610 [Candidatus Gastranaerophilales bacterium]|nr:hypothetical protein [Candidatus Gastranaerophilales bacterium]
MKIQNLLNPVSFKKTLVANCSVIKKENTVLPCQIYSLSQKDDIDYFEKVSNAKEWKSARYLCYLKDDLKTIDEDEDYSIFTLENLDGDCLAYSEIVKKPQNIDEVLYLETVPSQTYLNSHKATCKYIGETMLSFMVKKSKQEKSRRVELHPSISSTSFYLDNCYFTKPHCDTEPFYIPRYRYPKLIEKNETHTHSTIELIG